MDINQAVVTVSRASGPDAYADDPPLTQVGYSGAQLVGRSLSKRSLNIHTVYSSPSLRCIQVSQKFTSCSRPEVCPMSEMFSDNKPYDFLV